MQGRWGASACPGEEKVRKREARKDPPHPHCTSCLSCSRQRSVPTWVSPLATGKAEQGKETQGSGQLCLPFSGPDSSWGRKVPQGPRGPLSLRLPEKLAPERPAGRAGGKAPPWGLSRSLGATDSPEPTEASPSSLAPESHHFDSRRASHRRARP